jgi:hypothetical protein
LQLKARRKELHKENNCTVWPTILVPAASQLPLFVGISMVLNRASLSPSVLDSESFLTLTSLTHGDPTLTLPIVLGVVTFANVDATRFFTSPDRIAMEQRQEELNEKKRAAGEIVRQPRKIFQNTLRIVAVGRILIAALVPGVCCAPHRRILLTLHEERTAVLGYLCCARSASDMGDRVVGSSTTDGSVFAAASVCHACPCSSDPKVYRACTESSQIQDKITIMKPLY